MPKNYDSQSAADLADELGSSVGFGDSSILTTIWNDLTGNTAQQKQFEQQEYLMDKENAYNTPAEQVKRLREAGINVNSAAAQIAQNNTSASPQQVADNTQGVANAVKSLAELGTSVASGVATPSSITKNLADARRTNELLDYEKQQFKDSHNLNDAQWEALKVSNKWLDDEHRAALMLTDSQVQMAQSQAELFRQQCLVAQEEINALKAAGDKDAALAAQIKLENDRLQFHVDFMKQWHMDPLVPYETMMAEALMSGSDDYHTLRNALYDYFKEQQQASGDVEVNTYGKKQEVDYDYFLKELESNMSAEMKLKWKSLAPDLIEDLLGTAAKVGGFILTKKVPFAR